MYLNGGTVTAVSNKNDAIDSNGNMTITGGTIIACGGSTPECGLDAAERYSLYIKGGTVLAIGANNNSVTSTTGSQCLVSTNATRPWPRSPCRRDTRPRVAAAGDRAEVLVAAAVQDSAFWSAVRV